MTQVLTIPTPFNDFSELTENFAQRVDEERLMLPCSAAVPEGEWVQFSVLLGDGEVALAGIGRVQGAFDNGDEHPPEYRFDVVLDSLQFEGMHEVMFERLLMARSSILGAEPVTGEVSIAELEEADQSASLAEPSAEQAPPEGWEQPSGFSGEADFSGETDFSGEAISTPAPNPFEPADEAAEPAPSDFSSDSFAAEAEANFSGEIEGFSGEIESSVELGQSEPETPLDIPEAAPAAPVEAPRAVKAPPAAAHSTRRYEPGHLPSPHSFSDAVLTRHVLPAPWAPQPSPRPAPAQSSGLFDYGGPVPSPTKPPRPELDDALRVRPAPHPSAPWPRQRAQNSHALAASTEPPVELDGDASVMLAEQPSEQLAEHEEW